MALPLNVYQKLSGITSTSPEEIYTTPIGYTAVVLLGQVANTGNQTERVLFSVIDGVSSETTEITPNSPVSGEDAIKLFTGKMFVMQGDKLELSGTSATNLKYFFSILETLN